MQTCLPMRFLFALPAISQAKSAHARLADEAKAREVRQLHPTMKPPKTNAVKTLGMVLVQKDSGVKYVRLRQFWILWMTLNDNEMYV